MYCFMNKSKGAISIFLIIILMASFLLGGFFIDASRILVAERKVRMSMNTAARSTLAHYDGGLVGEYGLYGIDKSQVDPLFKKYFENNMNKGTSVNSKMYNYTVVKSTASVDESSVLSSPEMLGNQIAEFQKYRAPVNVTIGLVEKFTQMFDLFGGATSAAEKSVDDAENFQKSYEDGALEIQSDATRVGRNTKKDLKSLSKNSDTLSDQDIENAFRHTETDIDNIKTKLEEQKTQTNVYKEKQKENLSEVNPETKPEGEESDKSLSKQAEKNIQSMEGKVGEADDKIKSAKNDVKTANNAYKDASADYETKKQEYERLKSSYDEKLKDKLDDIKKYNTQIKANEDKISNYFSLLTGKTWEHKAEAEKKRDEYKKNKNDKQNKDSEIRKNVKDDTVFTDEEKKWLEEIFDLYDDISAAEGRRDSESGKLSKEQTEVEAAKREMETAERTKKERKNALDDTIDGIDSKLRIKIDDDDTDIEVDDLETSPKDSGEKDNVIRELKDKIGELGREMPSAVSGNDDELDDKNPFKMLKGVIGYINNMIRVFSDIDSFRNECYKIDYIMDRNTFLTSQSEYNHYFRYGEVEYIIFGKSKQVENLISSVASIYTIRFAIDTLDAFVTSAVPELISRIIEAVAEGLVQAAMDLKDMMFVNPGEDSAKGCGICPSLDKVKLSYSDHLRILMLLRLGNNDERLINAMNATLKDERGGKGIAELYTRINCSVEVEVNLIILPMFNPDGIAGDRFRNGKYVIRGEMSDGYQ